MVVIVVFVVVVGGGGGVAVVVVICCPLSMSLSSLLFIRLPVFIVSVMLLPGLQ